MGKYSFKSVGLTQEQTKKQQITTSVLPVGIVTPLQPAADGSLLMMSYTLAEQIKCNLHDLILTNWGERLGLYDFGANLKSLCSEFQTQDDFDNAAMTNIKNAITKWMPYIDLEDYSSVVDNPQRGSKTTYISKQVVLTITYSVSQLQLKRQGLSITLNVL